LFCLEIRPSCRHDAIRIHVTASISIQRLVEQDLPALIECHPSPPSACCLPSAFVSMRTKFSQYSEE
jgi:hypothetical protein